MIRKEEGTPVNRKTLKTLVALAVMAGLMGLAHQAHALAFKDANYIGLVNDGIPSNPTDEVEYINALISLAAGQGDTTIGTEVYNREGSTINCGTLPCPTAVLAGNSGNVNTSVGTGIDVTGFTYLLAKYDGPNEGQVLWYVGNLTGVQSIPNQCCIGPPGETKEYGLSHYILFNPTSVPEPTTLLLLGLTGAGVAVFARKAVRKA